MYTYQEIMNLGGSIDTRDFGTGIITHIVTKRGSTINYYRKNEQGTWDNYHCRTQY